MLYQLNKSTKLSIFDPDRSNNYGVFKEFVFIYGDFEGNITNEKQCYKVEKELT